MKNAEKEQQMNLLITLCSKHLQEVSEACIKQFSKTLFPMLSAQNSYIVLFNSLQTFVIIKSAQYPNFEDIEAQIISKAHIYGENFSNKIAALLKEEQFSGLIKTKLSESLKEINKQMMSPTKFSTEENSQIELTTSKNIEQSEKEEKNKINPPTTANKVSQKGLSRQDMTKKIVHISNNQTGNEMDVVFNLANRGICLCQQECKGVNGQFKCIHCSHYYHLECMKKKGNPKCCSLCHLTRLIPNREVKKVLFLGLMKKGKKKHEVCFNLSEQDLTSRFKIHIRSFRLKEKTQQFVLFPDASIITVNNFLLKQFQPLHRQSSLKYRKDEPYFIEQKYLNQKENKIVIGERSHSKQNKDERIEPDNHLIGIFLYEDKKVDTLVKEISTSMISSFQESKELLELAFIGSDEVTCEVVKIPLVCTISTEKIKYPVRGVLCSHYQCFDLYNFLVITSSSSNPRWLCPLCKNPCYEFKLDCILLAILNQYEKYSVTEVMFFKTGEFSVHTNQRMIKQRISNIHDLLIESQGKRLAQSILEGDKKKKKNPIPENTKFISLDDD